MEKKTVFDSNVNIPSKLLRRSVLGKVGKSYFYPFCGFSNHMSNAIKISTSCGSSHKLKHRSHGNEQILVVNMANDAPLTELSN